MGRFAQLAKLTTSTVALALRPVRRRRRLQKTRRSSPDSQRPFRELEHAARPTRSPNAVSILICSTVYAVQYYIVYNIVPGIW